MNPNQLFSKKLLLPAMLVMIGLSLTITSKANPVNGDERKPRKEKAIRINSSVKVFPDIIKRCMYVKSNQEKEINFLLFDMQGNLVLDYKLKKGERKTITVDKGDYVYVTFCDDVKIGTGKMEMR